MNESTEITETTPKKKVGRPRRLDKPEKIKRGRGRPKKEGYVSFEEARAWARKQGIKNYKHWLKFKKRRDKRTGLKFKPAWVPANPERFYKDKGWLGSEDFFGFGYCAYFPYYKAKTEARKLQFTSVQAWRAWWAKYRPTTVPCAPNLYYKEWENWNEWLDNNNKFGRVNHNFVTYEQAKKIVHPLKFRNQIEYFKWCSSTRPFNLPANPYITYKNRGWESWTAFLGRTVTSRLETKNINTAVWYIAQYPNLPDNVIEISIDGIGKKMVLEKAKRKEFILLKVYKFELSNKPQVEMLINQFTKPYWDNPKQRMCSNVPQMIFNLDQILEWA